MATDNAVEPVNIMLSRDELLLVLGLINAEYIPGLDADPLGELSTDQLVLALTVAGRGLRARGLARVRETGELAVHAALLAAVSACAYSQNAVFVYHWPAKSETPTRYFGHLREGAFVAHTRPEDVLHLFTVLPSKDRLIEQVLAVCQYQDVPAAKTGPVQISGQDFARMRELAEKGDLEQAIGILAAGQAPPGAAERLVETLAGGLRLSIVQTLKQLGDGSVSKRDFTLVQNEQQAWLVIAKTDDTATLLAEPATRVELRTILSESL